MRVWGNVYSMKVYVFFSFHEFCLAKEIEPHSIYPYAELLFYICTIDEYSMNKCFFHGCRKKQWNHAVLRFWSIFCPKASHGNLLDKIDACIRNVSVGTLTHLS